MFIELEGLHCSYIENELTLEARWEESCIHFPMSLFLKRMQILLSSETLVTNPKVMTLLLTHADFSLTVSALKELILPLEAF